MTSLFPLLLPVLMVLACVFAPVSLSLDHPAGKTNVYVTIYFNDVSQIDGVTQQFVSDFYLSAFWIDNRVDPLNETAEVWDPVLEFPNAIDLEATILEPIILGTTPSASVLGLDSVPAGTWIRFDQRYIGTFSTFMPLADFPFDKVSILHPHFCSSPLFFFSPI